MKSGKCLRLNLDETRSPSQDFQELQINREPEIWFFRHVDASVVCRQLKHQTYYWSLDDGLENKNSESEKLVRIFWLLVSALQKHIWGLTLQK